MHPSLFFNFKIGHKGKADKHFAKSGIKDKMSLKIALPDRI